MANVNITPLSNEIQKIKLKNDNTEYSFQDSAARTAITGIQVSLDSNFVTPEEVLTKNLPVENDSFQSAIQKLTTGLVADEAVLNTGLNDLDSRINSISGTVHTLSGEDIAIDKSTGAVSIATYLDNRDEIIAGALNDLHDDISGLNDGLSGTNIKIDEVSGTVSSVSGTLTNLSGTVNSLTGTVNNLSGTVNSLTGTVNNLSGTVNSLTTTSQSTLDALHTLEYELQNPNNVSGMTSFLDTVYSVATGFVPVSETDSPINIKQYVDGISGTVSGLGVKIDEVSGTVSSVSGTVNNLSGTVAANYIAIEKDISTNTKAIEANATNIADNKTAIITNTTNIATNKAAIEANATNIAANKTSIDLVSGTVNNLLGAIAANKADIEANETNIASVSGTVNNLSGAVSGLDSRLNTLDDFTDTSFRNVASILNALNERITDLETALQGVESQLQSI